MCAGVGLMAVFMALSSIGKGFLPALGACLFCFLFHCVRPQKVPEKYHGRSALSAIVASASNTGKAHCLGFAFRRIDVSRIHSAFAKALAP